MKRQIERVGVLGSGIMGSGIAAHMANAGLRVLMLDILPADITLEAERQGLTVQDRRLRNRAAQNGLDAIKKSKPELLYSPKFLSLIEIGNFEDEWERLAECDWIIEAVVERLDIKKPLFQRIEAVRRPGTVVSTNTSGIRLESISEGLGTEMRQHLLVTHFFNPVRYMRLLEVVAGRDTLPEVIDAIAEFGTRRLGKGVVRAKDTPNFIANRIGSFSMMARIRAMMELDYRIDEVDVITGPATGQAKSATFGTLDLVGLDTFAHSIETLRSTVKDEAGDIFEMPAFIRQLLQKGHLGRKSGAGFYKMIKKEDGTREKLVLDWKSGEYRPAESPRFESLGKAMKAADPVSRAMILAGEKDRAAAYFNRVSAETMAYASHRLGEIADSVSDIDNALRWGFNAEAGVFESWDMAGVPEVIGLMRLQGVEPAAWVQTMLEQGCRSFYRFTEDGKEQYNPKSGTHEPVERPPTHQVLFELKRQKGRIVFENEGAALVDLGEGVACLEFHSTIHRKLNPIDAGMGEALARVRKIVPESFRGLVIHHQNEHFCTGANLGWLLEMCLTSQWRAIETAAKALQDCLQASRRAPYPVVTAPFGLALAGGAEIAMAADRVCAHAELYIGLVEAGVGLVPGAGGHLRMMERMLDPLGEPILSNMPFVRRAFEVIAMGKVSTSAEDARQLGFLRPCDHIEMNRDRQLWTAKRMVIGLDEEGYLPPPPRTFQLPGRDGVATLEAILHNMQACRWISAHDAKIARHSANILCGGDTTLAHPVSEERILELEREAFLSLCGEPKTVERIEHMLKTKKPLRN